MGADQAGLTLREARVARLVADGRTDEEIAARLGFAVTEVAGDLAELYRKLGVRSRTELALLIAPPAAADPERPDEPTTSS